MELIVIITVRMMSMLFTMMAVIIDLEVTGLLGDACSFTVNIADNDNIEIIDGYGVVSLVRLE